MARVAIVFKDANDFRNTLEDSAMSWGCDVLGYNPALDMTAHATICLTGHPDAWKWIKWSERDDNGKFVRRPGSPFYK